MVLIYLSSLFMVHIIYLKTLHIMARPHIMKMEQ